MDHDLMQSIRQSPRPTLFPHSHSGASIARRFGAPLPPAADDIGTMIADTLPMAGRSADDPDRQGNTLNLLEKSEF
jgi:hypothetical protein